VEDGKDVLAGLPAQEAVQRTCRASGADAPVRGLTMPRELSPAETCTHHALKSMNHLFTDALRNALLALLRLRFRPATRGWPAGAQLVWLPFWFTLRGVTDSPRGLRRTHSAAAVTVPGRSACG
jgi:hypothetical protein